MLINPHPANWKEALHESLRESEGFVYALVDGVHNEAVYQKLQKMDYLHYQSLYATAPSADEETLGLGPILVQYSDTYRKRWDELLEMTNGLPALSIIVSPEPMDKLAARLIPWCVVDADDYTVALSFADTRILPTLVGTLDARQRGEFLGLATRWIYPGRDAVWLALMVEPEKALSASENVALTAQQVSALMAASEPDSIAYQMSQYIGKPLAGYTPFDAHVMISRWLQVADHVKMESNRDRFALCEFGVERPELIEDARYLALLESGGGPRTLDETRAFLA
ncbi:DUF4123 domain-containing protein [Oxalobacteraceae bacterium OTU3REALA1]|nr:DUF4123 domain-containing protein [Oxalobacteraceae bacterium OTU3REALA1]